MNQNISKWLIIFTSGLITFQITASNTTKLTRPVTQRAVARIGRLPISPSLTPAPEIGKFYPISSTRIQAYRAPVIPSGATASYPQPQFNSTNPSIPNTIPSEMPKPAQEAQPIEEPEETSQSESNTNSKRHFWDSSNFYKYTTAGAIAAIPVAGVLSYKAGQATESQEEALGIYYKNLAILRDSRNPNMFYTVQYLYEKYLKLLNNNQLITMAHDAINHEIQMRNALWNMAKKQPRYDYDQMKAQEVAHNASIAELQQMQWDLDKDRTTIFEIRDFLANNHKNQLIAAYPPFAPASTIMPKLSNPDKAPQINITPKAENDLKKSLEPKPIIDEQKTTNPQHGADIQPWWRGGW